MRHVLVSITISACLALNTGVAFAQSAAPKAAATTIDFDRDIRPIFEKHCYRCHSSQKMEGNLRLDARSDAEKGGISGKSVLGGTLETNSIYKRVTSTNTEERMPLAEKPLPAADIERIARWVEQKTPWPATTAQAANTEGSADQAQQQGFLETLGDLWNQSEPSTSPSFHQVVGYSILLLFVGLLAAHCRRSLRKERTWTTGATRPFIRLFGALRLSHCLVAILALSIVFVWRDLNTKLQAARTAPAKNPDVLVTNKGEAPTTEALYGSPPIPNRPHKLKEISGTYYRGNCERDEKLWNGGNYRTVTFKIELVDADKQTIKLGDIVKDGQYSLYFEMERAPKASPAFFTKNVTDNIFLTEYTTKHQPKQLPTSPPVSLKTLKPGDRWGNFYPLGNIPTEAHATRSGLVYVVLGKQSGANVDGAIHFGIKYDLIFDNHKIVEGSDVWMGELYITPPIAPPRPDKVPLNEWFDYRPIPEITGENTTDPKLLGLDALYGK